MVEQATRILVCDDSQTVRNSVVTFLNRIDNFEVVADAVDGPNAIESSRRLQPDVVLMDYEMPEMNGIEAAIRIKTDHPNTRVIMLTSSEDDSVIFKSLFSGADGYCLKKKARSLPSIILEALCSATSSGAQVTLSQKAKTMAI